MSVVWTLTFDLLTPAFLCCSFREVVGKKVVKSLKRRDDGISHACIDFLCALMQPMHDNYDLRQEQYNKRSLLSSKAFLNMLLEPLREHVVRCMATTPLHLLNAFLLVCLFVCFVTQKRGTGALVISALLDFFTFAICPPYRYTAIKPWVALFDSPSPCPSPCFSPCPSHSIMQ